MVRHATRGMTHTHTDQRACAGTVWCRVRLYGRLLSESESRCGVRVKAALTVLFSSHSTAAAFPVPTRFVLGHLVPEHVSVALILKSCRSVRL